MPRLTRTLPPVLTVALSALIGAGAAPSGHPPARPATRAADTTLAAVDSQRAAYVAAVRRGSGAAALYTPTARHVTPDGRVVAGADEIGRMYAGGAAAPDFTLTNVRVTPAGGYAYESGRYTRTVTRDGATRAVSGPYLIAWQRQPDGTWLNALAAVGGDQARASDTVKRGVAASFAAIRSLQPDTIVAAFAPDATVEDPVGAPPMTGGAALRAFYARMGSLFTRLDFRERDAVVLGDKAAVLWHADAVGANGRTVSFDGLDLLQVGADGRVRRAWAYWDPRPVVAATQAR